MSCLERRKFTGLLTGIAESYYEITEYVIKFPESDLAIAELNVFAELLYKVAE